MGYGGLHVPGVLGLCVLVQVAAVGLRGYDPGAFRRSVRALVSTVSVVSTVRVVSTANSVGSAARCGGPPVPASP